MQNMRKKNIFIIYSLTEVVHLKITIKKGYLLKNPY